MRKRLGALHDDGRIERSGEGKPRHPYKWRIHSAQPDPLVRNEKNGGPAEEDAPDWAEQLHEKYGEETDR